MNGDRITVIAAKMERTLERRSRIIEGDTEALRCFNNLLSKSNGRTASERFSDNLEGLRESMTD